MADTCVEVHVVEISSIQITGHVGGQSPHTQFGYVPVDHEGQLDTQELVARLYVCHPEDPDDPTLLVVHRMTTRP